MSRWKRTNKLTDNETALLKHLCSSTSGISVFGNKARSAAMLDLDLAWIAAQQTSEQSFGSIISSILGEYLSPMVSAFRVDENGGYLSSDSLLDNLALSFGGFITVGQASRSHIYKRFSESSWEVAGSPVALVKDTKVKLTCSVKIRQLIAICDGRIRVDPDRLDVQGFLVLQQPMPTEFYNLLKKIGNAGFII